MSRPPSLRQAILRADKITAYLSINGGGTRIEVSKAAALRWERSQVRGEKITVTQQPDSHDDDNFTGTDGEGKTIWHFYGDQLDLG